MGKCCTPACSPRGAPASACSPRSCRTRAARSRPCGRTRRFSRTSFARTSTSCSTGRPSTGDRAACRSPIPSSRSSAKPTGDPASTLHTGRIVPVYERTGSVTTNMQRRLVWDALEQLPGDLFDPVPADILAREGWPARHDALANAHFPDASTPIEALNLFETPAQRRLIFEDFFIFQSGLALRRQQNAQVRKALVSTVDDRVRAARRGRCCRSSSPTASGSRLPRSSPTCRSRGRCSGCCKEMSARARPSSRSWQRSWRMENGYQVAFMAPTEILAEQHFATLSRWLAATRYRVALLSGRITAADRRTLLPAIERGDVHLVVGTHALVCRGPRAGRAGCAEDRRRRAGSCRSPTPR